MKLRFDLLEAEERPQFKADMQTAFQMGAVEGNYEMDADEMILPEGVIEYALNKAGAVAYKVVDEKGKLLGGAIVNIDEITQRNRLDYLYVKPDYQDQGIGKYMWYEIEQRHPKTRTWSTQIPAFEKRNVHFYVNVCHFRIVEYCHPHETEFSDDYPDNEELRLEKVMHPAGQPAQKQIYLTTRRLILRQLNPRDAKAYFDLFNHPQATCFVPDKLATMSEAAREVAQNGQFNDGSYLAVCLKETNKMIGLLFGEWEGDTFSVCWNFSPKYVGKGYAYEATQSYFDLLFNELGARRIYAYVEIDNVRSQRLCRRLGMRQEALFEEFISFIEDEHGQPIYEDTLEFAILKGEWNRQF